MSHRLAPAALALAVTFSVTPALADQGFVAIQKDLLGSAPLASYLVDVNDADGISSGEVGDFLNAIPDLQAKNIERRCNSAVQLPAEHLATTVTFCHEVLGTVRDIERSDKIEAIVGG